MPSVFSLGYEKRTIEEMIALLKDNKIQLVVDIREKAISRKKGFSKNTLKDTLQKEGIDYLHIPQLGSPSDIRKELKKNWDYQTFFEKYERHILKFEKHIDKIKELAISKNTAILCFERKSNACHRSIVTKILQNQNCNIIDL